MPIDIPLSRRRLLRLGATGATAVAVGAHWSLLESGASAAPLSASLRRSTWNALDSPSITATQGTATRQLELVRVADLPVADRIPTLRGHDAAFSLEFDGAPGLPQGTATLTGPELGTLELFLVPIGAPARGVQRYEAVIDRTIRVAGINEEGTPVPVEAPAARASAPAAAGPGRSGTAPAATPRRAPKTPALRRALVSRTGSGRRLAAELSLTSTRDVVGVRATLLHGDRVVARAFSGQRRPHRLRLTLTAASPLTRSRYQLVVRMIAADGRVTSVRRSVRLG